MSVYIEELNSIIETEKQKSRQKHSDGDLKAQFGHLPSEEGLNYDECKLKITTSAGTV